MFALPAHRTLLEAQHGVLVHSEWARRKLLEEEIDVAVRVVPMPMPAPVLTDEVEARSHELRRCWGIPEGAPLLGSFGFQTPIKRTASAVRALAHPALHHAHLVVGGQQSPGLDLEALAQTLGVGGRVHLLGFLPHDDFGSAIRACDLCINLRFPTAGETSASLLRIFALGRATVVSDYAQFRDLPAEFALPVTLGDDPADESTDSPEVAALAAACADALGQPERLERRGRAARRWIEDEHDPRASAGRILQACAELLVEREATTARAPRPQGFESPPPTSLTWGELQCTIEVQQLEGWQPGERRTLEVGVRNDSACTWLPASAGDGGVLLEIRLRDVDGTDWAARAWPGLTRRLPPGAWWRLRVALRRPLLPAVLEIEPHVAGGFGFSELHGSKLRLDLAASSPVQDALVTSRCPVEEAAESTGAGGE
jgi:hypothetical protein